MSISRVNNDMQSPILKLISPIFTECFVQNKTLIEVHIAQANDQNTKVDMIYSFSKTMKVMLKIN